MRILTLETTCDETAAAVIDGDMQVMSAVVASQDKLHQRFGGVVPEIASRAHVERIVPVIDEALSRAQLKLGDLDAVAVANMPGLAGSLLVGLSAAKALCAALDIPLVAVNHLQAHVYACRLAAGRDVFPCIALIVSGGHTNLYRCASALDFTLLGSTIDDAAGEAFDKAAAMLKLPYPGGPSIQKSAAAGNVAAYRFPRSFVDKPDRLQFSFSGLKTALRYAITNKGEFTLGDVQLTPQQTADLAASFQEAVVDVLAAKCFAAMEKFSMSTLCVGGGVAANSRLRERLERDCAARGVTLHVPPLSLCTDNAVMGAIAIERLKAGLVENLDLDISPGVVRA